MTRTTRSIASFGSLLLVQIVSIGIGVFSTPLIIQWLGDERYGAFRAATDVGGYVLLMEFGIGGALSAMLAKTLAQGDREKILQTIGVGLWAYLKVLAGMLAVGLGFVYFMPTLLSVKGAIAVELRIGFAIGLLSLLLIPLNTFQVLLDASQRNYIKNALLIVQSILITALLLVFAWLKLGIPGQFLAVLIGSAVSNLAMAWDSLRRYPLNWTVILQARKAKSIEQQLWQLNIPNLLIHLSARVGLMTDTIVISYFLGTAAVVPFIITQRLATLAQAQLQGVGVSTWAALAELHAQGKHEEFENRLVDLIRLLAIFGLAMMVPIAAYNVHFVTLWMGAERFGGWEVNGLIAVNSFLRGVIYLGEWCFVGTGHFAQLVPFSIVCAATNLIMSLVSTQYFGIAGPLIGTFFSLGAIAIWWLPRLLQKTFGVSPKRLFGAIVRPLVLGIPYGAIVVWFAAHHIPFGWIGLISEMATTALLYLFLVWSFVFTADEQAQWMQRVIAIAPKLKVRS